MKLRKRPMDVEGVVIQEIKFFEEGGVPAMIIRCANAELPDWFAEALANDTIDGQNVHKHEDGSVHGQVALKMSDNGQPSGAIEIFVGDLLIHNLDGEIYKVPADKIARTYEFLE